MVVSVSNIVESATGVPVAPVRKPCAAWRNPVPAMFSVVAVFCTTLVGFTLGSGPATPLGGERHVKHAL